MAIGQKRKSQWSSPNLFRSRNSSRVALVETSTSSSSNIGSSKPSFDDVGVEKLSSKATAASRLRRGSSKLLSMFRLKKSSGNHKLPGSSYTTFEHDTAVEIARDAASAGSVQNISNAEKHGLRSSGLTSSPVAFMSPTAAVLSSTTPQTAQSLGEQMDGALEELTQPRIASTYPATRKSSVSSLRQSKSSPGLSHKLSTKFVHPTVVHRPNLKSRPSLASLASVTSSINITSDLKSVFQPPLRQANTQDTTDPSSPSSNSNTMSPVEDPSTGKTSLLSEVACQRSAEAKARLERLPSKAKTLSVVAKDGLEKTLTPIIEIDSQAPLPVTPSIVTVETTAAAKIFFETHFDRILFGHNTPRSLRRHELELRLQSEPMSSEQRMKERSLWAKLESDYLRQVRVQKAKSMRQSDAKAINVAGYEVVKVLGKGSFGVVRLVRHKQTVSDSRVAANFSSPREAEVVGFATQETLAARRPTRTRGLETMKKEVYAMKVIRKSDMLRNSQEGHLRAERDFLVASTGSRWVVPLISAFQDSNNLYLVMDYMLGGDFLGLLIRKNTLSEDITRWYVAEMILCVEEAHRLKWIHRDVKPDNFLISASGHLKISDFGLAFDGHWAHDQAYFNNHRYSLLEKLGIKIEGDEADREEGQTLEARKKIAKVLAAGKERHEKPSDEEDDEKREGVLQWRNRTAQRRLARSVVGTSQYMAPEVIRGELYDGRCDWWSIGIILYECLYGHTPFCCEDRQKTKERILRHTQFISYPPRNDVSLRARDLIGQLLREKEYRLCSKKYRINDIELQKATAGPVNVPVNQLVRDYAGLYVYPDDATELKSHPFFRCIPWDYLHLMKPPFVPRVKSWEDTKYFEEEEPISDVDDSSSYNSAREELEPEETDESAVTASIQQATWNANEVRTVNEAAKEKIKAKFANEKGKVAKKERKRPRDMLLRDKEVGRKVLEIRKKGAFMGYTYRRPHGCGPFLQEDESFLPRGRAQRERMPSMV